MKTRKGAYSVFYETCTFGNMSIKKEEENLFVLPSSPSNSIFLIFLSSSESGSQDSQKFKSKTTDYAPGNKIAVDRISWILFF